MGNLNVFVFVSGEMKVGVLAEAEEVASARLTHYLQEHEQLPKREFWKLQQIAGKVASHIYTFASF
jgi:hypothetical protein